MTETRVLHLNATLSEGGAAGVARTLHEEMIEHGLSSRIVYGYGPHGGPSPLESQFQASRLAARADVAFNRLWFPTSGHDHSRVHARRWQALRHAAEASDVIHLHVIHSYFASTTALGRLIQNLRKPVVWTLHDQWIMTGRCAQPKGCRRWEIGCHPCPHLSAYPPAWVDHTATTFGERREFVSSIRASAPLAIVACADWLRRDAEQAGLGPIDLVHNSVDREFWGALSTSTPRTADTLQVVLVCKNLRDQGKVHWPTIAAVAEIPGIAVTVVGDDPPFRPEGVTFIPSVSNRTSLARLLQHMDVLLFTSVVDYFPLTIVEALTAGLRILAVDSDASRELKEFGDVAIFSTVADAKSALLDMQLSRTAPSSRPEYFAPSRMANDYAEIYRRLLAA